MHLIYCVCEIFTIGFWGETRKWEQKMFGKRRRKKRKQNIRYGFMNNGTKIQSILYFV